MCGFSIVRSAPLRYCGGRAALASEVTMSKQFVFVHGMSHGAWCWAAVQARLERAGHATLAVDLPGHGRRALRRAGGGQPARGVGAPARGAPRVVEALPPLPPQPFRPGAERVPMRRFY